jgi:hypothetical protein
MPKEVLAQGSSARAWQDGDHFKVVFMGLGTVKPGKGKPFQVVRFQPERGPIIERNVTTKWEELCTGKNPVVQPGDVLEVKTLDEQKTKGKGNRSFRPFEITRLTGSDIPAGLRVKTKGKR